MLNEAASAMTMPTEVGRKLHIPTLHTMFRRNGYDFFVVKNQKQTHTTYNVLRIYSRQGNCKFGYQAIFQAATPQVWRSFVQVLDASIQITVWLAALSANEMILVHLRSTYMRY
jgi:hypothetical protein